MRTHGAVVGRRFRSVTKLTTKVGIGRGYLWGRFLIAAAALKTPTRNGYNAQGVNLNFRRKAATALPLPLQPVPPPTTLPADAEPEDGSLSSVKGGSALGAAYNTTTQQQGWGNY